MILQTATRPWLGETLPDVAIMQRIAAEVGYYETAFIAPAQGQHRMVRYYSPCAEVSFSGHATVAAGVLLGHLEGAVLAWPARP